MSNNEVERDMSWLVKTIDAVVTKQRPLVVRHLQQVRSKHPDLTPEQLIARVEKQFLAAVSTSGAAVGASAVAPGIGTVASVALTAAETVAFLEASAFYAQAVTEIHGIHVQDPERSKALVMSLMLGAEGSTLVRRVSQEALGRSGARDAFWGQLITTKLPGGFVADRVTSYLKKALMRRLAATTGRSALGRALPFGIGAVIGGVGNHILGRQIVKNAREAFGPAPVAFDSSLDPQPKAMKPKRIRKSLRERIGDAQEQQRKPGFGGFGLRGRSNPEPTKGDIEPPAADPADR